MEVVLPEPPSSFSCGLGNTIVVGYVDGIVQYGTYDLPSNSLQAQWKFQTKGSVRGLVISHDQSDVFAITSNRGISCFDIETGRRKRCIKRGHNERPTSICLRHPDLANRSHHFSTGDESGEVQNFEFLLHILTSQFEKGYSVFSQLSNPQDVNALRNDNRHNLLSASADGTLAVYDVRKRRLRVKSEVMPSELLSLCVTEKYVYVGARGGYLEVFAHGDFGNILQRIRTGFDMGVDDVVELRKGLLIACSGSSDKLKLINVIPTKKLGVVGKHGDDDGVDQLMVSTDGSTLISMSTFASSIKFWALSELLEEIPMLPAAEMKKRKPLVKERFFDDLMEKKAKRRAEDDQNHSGDQSFSANSDESGDIGDNEELDDDECDHYTNDEDEVANDL
ncbi:hypothetical protein Angca_005677 [Angiostrongylus cantonensis]|nr:hypothetical protein Angca_005677 [Angiostrongylus cantonensis]